MVNNRRLVVFSVVAAVVLAAVLFFGLPVAGQWRMSGFLRDAGFFQAHIDKTSRVPGGYDFKMIRLDNNNFSTVEQMVLHDGNLTINRPVMTGDWKTLANPDISGWVMPPDIRAVLTALEKKGIKTITLNGGQLDISVPTLGLIRLEAKGQVTLMPDGAIRIQSALWSVQQKMKMELKVSGEFAANGIASVDIEIGDGRLTLPDISANRLGGWMILNKDKPGAPWSVSGQILAGAASLSGLPLNALISNIQGTIADTVLTVQAGVPGSDNADFNADIHIRRAGEDSVAATLKMDHFKKNRPGMIVAYNAKSKTIADLMDTGTMVVSDLAGKGWMQGQVRRAEATTEIDIQQIAIQPLTEMLGIADLTAEGTMTGLLALRQDQEKGMVIDQGLLRSTNKGVLSFSGDALPPFAQSASDKAAAMLRSFQYDMVEVSLSGPVSGTVEGDISLNGTPLSDPDSKPALVPLHFQGQVFGAIAPGSVPTGPAPTP